MNTDKESFCVVIPCHNEEAHLTALMARLTDVMQGIGAPWRALFVDDGSTDGTRDKLAQLRQRHTNICILCLSRNFGKEAALSAGLDHAGDDHVILMDGDLQHPPECIVALVQKWREGFDAVYAVRRSRKDDPLLRRWFSHAFYTLINTMTDGPVLVPRDAGDFRLLDRCVVRALRALPERTRFMKGLYAWVGFRQTSVLFDVAPRSDDASRFSLRSLWTLALDGIASMSALPLKIWSYVGMSIAVLALVYALIVVVQTLAFGRDVPGYATLIVAILFIGGLQLLSLGVIGEYLARIFDETKNRPLYLVRERIGFDPED